jgi:LPXTG-site transpeptidase (sortase) family protein
MYHTPFLTIHGAERAIQQYRLERQLRWLKHRVFQFFWTTVCFGAIFFILSAPSQYDRLVYTFSQWLTPQESPKSDFSPAQFLGNEPAAPRVVVPVMENNTLMIPSIDVSAPIIWNVPIEDALNNLQHGVVHVRESYLPGEKGRTFIVGHSSGYWWLKNPWTRVFALLDQANDGDLVFLKVDDKTYAYQITHRETITPQDVSVIRDKQLDHNQLALMTCTPVGTALNRLVLYAEPVATEVDSSS